MIVSLKDVTLQYNNRSEENQPDGWTIPADWQDVRGGVASTANGALAWGRGEEKEIAENRRVWAKIAGFCPDSAVSLEQVHEATIVHVGPSHRSAGFLDPQSRLSRADGLLTAEPNVVLVTSHADCAPIFLYSETRKAIALVHAGWRGTLMGIASVVVRQMAQTFLVSPKEIRVAVGPMIDTLNYEVGDDVAGQFSTTFGPQAIAEYNGRPHLDLFAAISIDLLRAGLLEQNLGERPPSTYDDARWSSFRRDGTHAGGMLAFFTLN